MGSKRKSLHKLMAARGKGQTSKAPTKSQTHSDHPPAPLQILANLDLKANPNLKKKRPVESLEESEVGPRQGGKQQKMTREQRDKRAPLMESQEEIERAEIIQQVFVAEQWCRDNRKLAYVEALSRAEVEKALGALKQEHHELSENLKAAKSGFKSAEVGLKTAERQAEDQRQKLYVIETNLATEKQAVLDLKAALQKAKEEARLAKEEAQLVREAAEAEKKASYQLRAEETEARLSEELLEVYRDPCSIKSFFPPEIQEIPADAIGASEQAMVVPDAIPLVEITKGSGQVAFQGEDVEEEKGKGKGKGKKTSSKAKDLTKEAVTKDHGADLQVKDVPPPQSEQKEDPPAEA
ncbi:uncharacterized protein LOC126696279 [Quercus robur]|uniref:uncharacterized protein LOC126696279 n=1 Tax=Quercus robur TaxID=38942 RepID=UPI0021614852|nr:uncharacterized protein LOC126696279 [Quercus robur]